MFIITFYYMKVVYMTNKVKNLKKSKRKQVLKTQKAQLANEDKLKCGIKSVCFIQKGEVITYYGVKDKITKDVYKNILNIYTNRKILEGDPSKDKPLLIGQFANDMGFDMKILDLIKSGDIKDAHELYIKRCEEYNNAQLGTCNKQCLVATRDIHANEYIYTTSGLSFWINYYMDKLKDNPYYLSRLNTYALTIMKMKNDFIIFHDVSTYDKYNYEVKEILNKKENTKYVAIVHDDEIISEGYALILLCKLMQINRLYFNIQNLPSWIYESPYKSLLYWILIIQLLPKSDEELIFQLMKDNKTAEAFRVYNNCKNTELAKKYVNFDNFVFYYKRWKDTIYLLHHHKFVQNKK